MPEDCYHFSVGVPTIAYLTKDCVGHGLVIKVVNVTPVVRNGSDT